MAKNILDLKRVLEQLDLKNYNYYDTLTEEEKKAFSPWVISRYMSSGSLDGLISVNEVFNLSASELKDHKKLQWMLLASCGMGKKQHHPWINAPKGLKQNKKMEILANFLPDLKPDDIELLLHTNFKQDIVDFLLDNGLELKDVEAFYL